MTGRPGLRSGQTSSPGDTPTSCEAKHPSPCPFSYQVYDYATLGFWSRIWNEAIADDLYHRLIDVENSWQDERVVEVIRKTGRQQLVLAALWTEICLAMTAVQALADGYDVFIVTDASGGASVEAHDMAVRRMQAAGAVPITWLAVAAEWQRDWAREKTVRGFAEIITEHGGASSVAYAWEVQLLSTGAKAGA